MKPANVINSFKAGKSEQMGDLRPRLAAQNEATTARLVCAKQGASGLLSWSCRREITKAHKLMSARNI